MTLQPSPTDQTQSAIREKTCDSCGSRFACRAGQCWCDEVVLDSQTAATLSERFADCLCPACLGAAADAVKLPRVGPE